MPGETCSYCCCVNVGNSFVAKVNLIVALFHWESDRQSELSCESCLLVYQLRSHWGWSFCSQFCLTEFRTVVPDLKAGQSRKGVVQQAVQGLLPCQWNSLPVYCSSVRRLLLIALIPNLFVTLISHNH